MNKPVLEYDSQGPSGNVFWILAQARRILHKQARMAEYEAMWERVQSAGSYEQALEIISKYVRLIDIAK